MNRTPPRLVSSMAESEVRAALLESEERYRFLAESIPVQIWTALPDGRLDYVSNQTARHLGKSPGQLLDEGWQAVLHPDDLALAVERWLAALSTGDTYEVQFRLKLADGSYAWHLARAVPQRNEAGEIVRWFGTNTQIEQQRAVLEAEQSARAEAHAEREKQHALFMQAPVAISILEGSDHRFVFANPAYRALVNGRDVVGKALFDALPDVREQGFDALLDQVMTTGVPFVGKEVPIALAHHGDGEVLFLNFVYMPKRNAAGVIDGILMTGWDVTEMVVARKRAEALAEEVRAREAQLRLVTDALPVLVSFVGADERYQLVNKAYEQWFGHSSEFFVGRAVRDVIGEAAYEVLGPYVQRGLAGESFSFEQNAVPYRFGGTRDVKVVFVPHRGARGEVQGYVALIEDITARRQHEQERERLTRQRTEMLERQTEFEQQLIGIVSHDLRTPLHTIMLATTLLSRIPELDASAVKIATRAQNAADRATRMVRDLLDFTQARIGGGIVIERRPGDLGAVVDAVMAEVEVLFNDRRVEVQHQGDCHGAFDADRMGQVVQNLLTNALKYSPAESTVAVRTEGREDYVTLAVHNRGPAIPQAALASLFEPFQRAGKLDRAGRSVGLGLYIVRSIVAAHGGTVSASSSEAEGTTFLVALPRQSPTPAA